MVLIIVSLLICSRSCCCAPASCARSHSCFIISFVIVGWRRCCAPASCARSHSCLIISFVIVGWRRCCTPTSCARSHSCLITSFIIHWSASSDKIFVFFVFTKSCLWGARAFVSCFYISGFVWSFLSCCCNIRRRSGRCRVISVSSCYKVNIRRSCCIKTSISRRYEIHSGRHCSSNSSVSCCYEIHSGGCRGHNSIIRCSHLIYWRGGGLNCLHRSSSGLNCLHRSSSGLNFLLWCGSWLIRFWRGSSSDNYLRLGSSNAFGLSSSNYIYKICVWFRNSRDRPWIKRQVSFRCRFINSFCKRFMVTM